MGIKPMLQEFPQEKKASGGQPVTHGCESCCYYREVKLENRKLWRLCMLTGEKRPKIGMAGCKFVPGQWSQIDRILSLPSLDFFGNTGDPNNVKLGSGFSSNGRKIVRKDIDDFFGKPINHILGKGSLARPEYREVPVAHVARERA